MDGFRTELCRDKRSWALKVTTPSGDAYEYRYRSEKQARYFAAVFALGPTWLPQPSRKRVGRATS